jgi:hypothetical protein
MARRWYILEHQRAAPQHVSKEERSTGAIAAFFTKKAVVVKNIIFFKIFFLQSKEFNL